LSYQKTFIHLVLSSLPSQFSQFKISYNCQKEKWSLNELISFYVQEEERLKQKRTESALVVSTSKDKGKRKRIKKPKNEVTKGPGQKKQNQDDNCFFCSKPGHVKKRNVPNIMLGMQRRVCFLLWSVLRSI